MNIDIDIDIAKLNKLANEMFNVLNGFGSIDKDECYFCGAYICQTLAPAQTTKYKGEEYQRCKYCAKDMGYIHLGLHHMTNFDEKFTAKMHYWSGETPRDLDGLSDEHVSEFLARRMQSRIRRMKQKTRGGHEI